MKIKQNTLDDILNNTPKVPPETGGILGGRNQIISHYIFDGGDKFSNGYDIYSPNIVLFNQIIKLWSHRNIEFYGIFHTHFSYGKVLSDSDKQYIISIMSTMPLHITSLYFPIVFPREDIIAYYASRLNSSVRIIRDEIEIL